MTIEEYNNLINQPPTKTEVSEDGEFLLVPISVLEPDLNFVYNGRVQFIINSQTELFGSICMTISLLIFHPVDLIWQRFDGTAAIQINSVQQGEWENTTKIKNVNDIKTAIAACYSEAIKNASKRIGPRFGQSLNRQKNNAKMTQKEITAKKKKTADERVLHLIEDCESIMELNEIMKELPNNEAVQEALNVKLKELKKNKK